MKCKEHKFEIIVTTEEPEEPLNVLQHFARILQAAVDREKSTHLSEPVKSIVVDLTERRERNDKRGNHSRVSKRN